MRGRDPYWIHARFKSVCGCGVQVKKDDRVFYYPNDKKVLCVKCSEVASLLYWAEVQDEAWNPCM